MDEHFYTRKMPDTWQWLMARNTQLAASSLPRLPPPSLEPCCDASWHMAQQLQCTRKPWPWHTSEHLLHGSEQCPSASGPRGQELHLLIITHVFHIYHQTERAPSSCQLKAVRGRSHLPTGDFEDEANSRQRCAKAERKCHCYLVGF